jgi:hypothetical protein
VLDYIQLSFGLVLLAELAPRVSARGAFLFDKAREA